jgi:hypothetical protein
MVRLLCANFGNYNLVVELLGALHNLYYLDLPSVSFWRDISLLRFHQMADITLGTEGKAV